MNQVWRAPRWRRHQRQRRVARRQRGDSGRPGRTGGSRCRAAQALFPPISPSSPLPRTCAHLRAWPHIPPFLSSLNYKYIPLVVTAVCGPKQTKLSSQLITTYCVEIKPNQFEKLNSRKKGYEKMSEPHKAFGRP